MSSLSVPHSLLAFVLVAGGVPCVAAQKATPPPPVDPHVAAGSQVFLTAGCTHCHGEQAAGGESGPSLLDVGKRKDTAALTLQIHDGHGAMPAFGEALTADQIADLVVYLQTLKPAHKPRAKRAASK